MAYGYKIKKEDKEWTLTSVPSMEWTPRGGRRKARAKVRQQERQRTLLSLTMATGIFATPFGVGEAAIVRENGDILDNSGHVHEITPEKVVSNEFAYNRFEQFDLAEGHIAKLLFGKDSTWANTLANLVQNKININGIVNGVKNNKIDGHLIFLSPNGIAVGEKGVINAGQFTGIVPTKTAFDTLYNTENNITLDAINGLSSYAIKDAEGNAVGIDVKGQINTHSGVMLGAGIININDGAKIQSTKDLDFTSLVNISGGASSGLTNLTASQGTGGDIILTAKQTSEVKDTNPIRWSERSTDLSATINIGKDAQTKGVQITSSDGAVKLTAESTSTYEDSTPMTLTNTLKDVILGEDKTVLDGLIDKLAKKEATANKYLFVNYSSKKNKSAVNIGANSTITGKNIDIAANSKVDIKQSITVPTGEGKKDSNGETVQSGSKVMAAVSISRVYNTADVVIDGNLSATGADTNGNGINVSANANTKNALSATGNAGDGNAVAVGVAVLTGDTKSKVTVNEGATALSATKGKVSVAADTTSNVDINVNAVGNNSYVVSNVGVANYDTSADVVMERSITAGAVDIKAANNTTGLKMTVDNTVKTPAGNEENKGAPETSDAEKQQDDTAANAEKNKPDSEKSQDEKNSEKKSIDPTKVVKDANVDTSDAKTKDAAGTDGKGGVQDVKDKVEGSNDGGDNEKKNSAFGLGAAVGVVSNTNNANVTIGKNAVITATKPENAAETVDGSVNVTANSLMTASKDAEDSLGFSVNNTQANANAEIGAAVLVSNVKNNAKIVLDSEGEKSAQIAANGKTELTASAGMGKYNKTDNEEKTSTLSYKVSAKGTAEDDTPSKFVLDGSVGINTQKNNAIVLLGQKSKVDGSSVKLSADATTNAEGTYGATEENSKVGIGATLGLQNIRGNALVMAGKGVEIKGTESFEASASNTMDLKNAVKNAGKGDSIGVSGMVALSYGDSNSIVSLDDEANITTGFATITSTNTTNVENSARSESTGHNGAKAFGIGVGIVNYDVNSLAMVSDNGSGITAPSGNTTDAEKAAQKIYQDSALARSIAGDTLAGKLGAKTTGNAKGSITTGGLVGMALTTGMIQNDAKAKVVTASSDNGDENTRKDSEKWTKWSKQGTEGANEAKNNTQNLENTQETGKNHEVTSQNESAAPDATGAMGEASRAADPDGTNNTDDEGAAPTADSPKSAGASIGIEGSVALTFLGGRTDAVLDNVTVKSGTETEPAPVAAVSLSATDFLGSITLGGTDIKHSVNAGNSGTKVGIGGTFAMNSSNRDVDSLIRNTDMPMALMVSNSATKIGIEVAAGMGTSVGDGDGLNVNGAGVVYYNKAKQDIHALMLNNNVMGASVSNKATSTDFQIAGGLSGIKGSGANTNVGFGGAVAISQLENNLSSGIIGGSYTVLSSMDVEAQKGTTQINGALAGTKGGYGFEGAFAYGSAKNNTRAYIDGATVTGLTGSAVNVKAGEIPVVKTDTQLSDEKTKSDNKIDSSIGTNPNTIDTTKNYTTINEGTQTQLKTKLKEQANSALDKEKKTQEDNKKTLDDAGFDTTGESYLDKSIAASSLDDDAKNTDEGKIAGDAATDEDNAKGDLGQNHSLTITAAMGGGWNNNVGAGAGIAYNYVKNDIAADIKGSTITADTISGEAATDATIVSVGAGVAIGGKTFNGAGSGSWNDLKNDTKVTFENNTITGKNISEKAQNEASIINIAGEVAAGKGMAMGLSLAYNSLNNTTGTYLKGNTVTLTGDDNSVQLSTKNKSKALAVAGGVNVNISQSIAGAVGTVAINRGVNHTESVIDGKTTGENTQLDNVKELSVTAEELSKKTTVAGSVSVGGKKVGIGGAVAYTSVGSSSNKERLRAEINHANITTTENGTIEVSTKDSKTNGNDTDKSRVITVGAGFGVGWGKNYFNLQGGAAVSDIYKDSFAFLNNTNINATDSAKHPAIIVTADTKSKINTVGVGGSVDIGSQVKGAAGVAINRMYQDTKAKMVTASGITTVNAGLTQVRATGDGDIHSVGVGGLIGVGGQVAFAGSGSYNYIGNDVEAIIENQNLNANNSVGVVAQSDDRLYNFAGGFAIGANTKVGLGAAVSINKITGDTNALVQGGSLKAVDTGSIKVTRPQDDKLFTTENLDLATDRTKLSESRTEENKTGIVVDSSATHTIISQMSSGGVAASGSVGVDLAGTVNLNTIDGSTTAKIQDANLNTENSASNVNVNAVDYTNLGTFTGTATVGAAATAGVSVGVSADWETLNRTTTAEISDAQGSANAGAKKNVYAKDLTVDATAKHGSSTLSFAAAAGAAATAGVASGDSIMRHKNTSTTSALLKNTNTIFDGTAEIKAEHLGNSYSQNIAVTAAGGYAAVGIGAGVSVMDDASTVKAEVDNSELKAKSSESGKNISVLAKNENNWKETLVTASLAVGLGGALAANVGIHNTTGETAALVTNSNLKAYDVKVNATDKLTATSIGGVGAGGLAGAGVAVALNNINSSTSAHVTGGSVEAADKIDVAANETRSFDGSVTGAAAGGVGVGVNVAVTSINKGITDAQLSSAKDENNQSTGIGNTTQNEITKHLNSVNGAKGALGAKSKDNKDATFVGLKSTDSDIVAARNVQISLATPATNKQGVHTGVDGATLSAVNDVNVTAKDTSDIYAKNVGVTVGGAASVNVSDIIIHTNYDTDVTMTGANVTGKNVNINATQTQSQPNNDGKQGSDVRVTAVTVGALGGVGVGYAGIVNRGATDVDISNSTIKGTENVTVNATDESKHKSQILSVGVAAANVTTTFASVENYSNVGVTLAGTNNISAAKDITIDAKKANTLEAYTQGVGVGGVNVAVNHATIEDGGKDGNRDTGITAAKITGITNITGLDGKTSAEKFHFGATNDTTAKLSAGNTAVSILGVSRMRGKGVMNMGAEVNVAGGSFNANTVEFASLLGNANGRTLEGNVRGHNVSAVAVAPDAVILDTTATGTVNVANSSFADNTNLILDNKSYVDRKAYIYDVTAGAVAVGNTSADISGKETVSSTLTGKANTTSKLNSLRVSTIGNNTGKAFADAGGGGIVGYVGAHVDNKSTNTVTSSLSGNWDVQGDVYLLASQNDEVRLTASEGHGGIAGVGGTSVDNTITTTTKATVAKGTAINADRVHVGTSNAATVDAYDDTDSKGNKDAQTYTLKDHFGGVISGNRLRSLLDLTETGTITIGEGAKITTNNLQEYVASSQNNLTNLVQAKGGGAVAVTDAVSELDLDINNKVDVASGAALSNEKAASNEGIVLAAYDNQNLKSQVDGTVYAGVISPIVAKNNIDMNRTNDVSVAGTIESGADVGLYAGANKAGVLSNLNADLKSGAYNYSVIAITVPRVKYDITADKGTVNVSGTVRSTKDINAIASGGKEEIVKDESLWNWAKGGSSTDKKFLTSDATTAEESLPKLSTVNVNGALIAGTSDPINITISGSVAGGLEFKPATADDNNQTNQRVLAGITKGTFDYANTLGDRLRELNKLIAAYDGDSSKMAAYIAERDRIQSEMVRLGLVEKDANGNVVQYLNSGRSIYYVEIPDIATSGGNINVQANDLTGTGKLHANSAPSVTITNESDAYLKLNNILMGEQGGSIIYNKDNVIPPNKTEGNAKINTVNVHKTGAAFSELYGRTDSTAAGLTVQNTKTFSGDKTSTISLTPELEKEIDNNTEMTAKEKADYKQAIKNGEMKYTAITDVEVNGKVSNFYGNVTINNLSGDIRISGGTKERPTGVEGNTVTLTAANGTIAQDYKEGIVNINGDPEKYLSDKADELKRENSLKTDVNDTKSNNKTYTRSDSSQEATGYIAGRDVYVSAANVNVNGLIQSGYKNYAATVTEAQLNTAKTRPASRSAVIQNRTMYKVNDGGAKWNSTDKVFDYVPQVYWDPATDKLVVEDINTQGGKVYLTGKIASTGDGRIMAADGAAEISVVNETSLDMNVGQVLNNQREGIITIADTANDTWTEYKKGQTRIISKAESGQGYAEYIKAHANDGDPYALATKKNNNLSVGNNNNVEYAVKGGQVYSWINGNSVETTATYQHYERRGMWGLVQTADETTLNGWTTDSNLIEPKQRRELGLPDGAVINHDSSENLDSSKLYYDAINSVKDSRTFGRDHWVTRSGFLGWFKHIYDRWKVGTSSIQLYNYSLNASQPIKIGLIGSETGSITLASTNAKGGSINLTGNVANSHNQAQLNISSVAGGIFQNDGTTLKSEIVNLTAKDDIKNIHITSLGSKTENGVTDNIKLSAISTGTGDIDITAMGGVLNNQSLPGNVEIVDLKSQNGNAAFKSDAALGDVSLTAAGNITQADNTVRVEGRGINLTSNNGGIGTANQAINIAGSDLVYATDRYGAQVNAEAKGSIYLTEAEAGGDMRVGKIESREGDVKLTVESGGFIDGLPGDDKSGSNDSVDEIVHRWIDAGLIDGEKDAQGNYTYKGAYIEGLEKARDDYSANVVAAYDTQNGGKTQAEWREDYDAYKAAYDTYIDTRDQYANYDSLSKEERETLDNAHPGGYENYKQFNAQKKAFETEYNSYLANKARFDALSEEEKTKLAAQGDSDYKVYQYYSQLGDISADEYLKTNTTSYKYSQYADANAYLAADAKYQDLKAKAANPTFEWTKDMMLYAVSDKLVNPNSGSSAQTERAANVLGRNITLNSTKGAVGDVSDTSITISVDDLTGDNRIENMKKLMSMEASDVKAKRDANGNLTEFVITPNMPLGVKASGTLKVQAGGNVSVAGRKDENGEHSALKVGMVDATQNGATGDVRLHSELGIYNDLAEANGTNIKGKNLILTGGQESIGASEKPLTVSLSGDMTEIRADKNVFIKNMNTTDYLRLGAMYAKDIISLTSDKGFLMSNANGEIAQSYINAGKTLAFNTNANTGIVGNKDYAIRILNDRAPVNITAKSAYIKGVNNTDVRNGTLVLGTVNTKGEFVAASEGSLTVGREEEKDKAAVAGSVNAGGDVTLTAAENLTLDGAVTAVDSQNAKKNLTLTATNGSITQTDKGAITADKVKTFNGKSLLLENAENKFNSITVDGTPTEAEEKPAIAGDVRIKDNADALTVAINRKVAGDISVTNLRENGSLANVGNLTATGNIALSAQGTLSQAADTTFTAGKDVKLTSAAAGIEQAADAGIKATKVTAVSAKTVDLQGTGNQFNVLAVQSSDKNVPIQGSVSVLDTADKLEISIQPTINGDIAVENKKANGVLQVSSELQAKGDGVAVKGDITLKSDGSMQNNKKVTAANDVKITSTSGAMTINGDVSASNDITLNSKENMQTIGKLMAVNNVALTSTIGDVSIRGDVSTGAQMPSGIDFNNGTLEGTYNSLFIHAGGAIKEAAGVNITTPVVKTYSGKGVSMESEKNGFAVFFADALEGSDGINGSVKAVSTAASDGENVFTVGVGADIFGDAEFTNVHQQGELGILLKGNADNKIDVLGGNGAEGDLVLKANKDVMLLGDTNAVHDIVIDSSTGSFYGIGRGISASHDVNVSVGDAVYYIGGTNKALQAGNDISIETKNSTTENAGIHIGALPTEAVTSLSAGNSAKFKVNGNGNIDLLGNVVAEKDVNINISGKGNIDIDNSVQSKNESVSVQTGEGDIEIGTENVTDDETIKAKKNVTVGTNLGTVYILGKTITETGDITMKAGKETYQAGADNSNFIIKDDGQLISGGGIGLYGRNGDIEITDDIQANKGITVNIAGQGNITFGRDVTVTNDVDFFTDKGNITVDHTVNSDDGMVRMESGNGNIMVGKDITAGKDVTISTQQGDVTIGDTATGDDGDILSKTGNVSIKTEKGNVGIVKTVTAQEGSLGITSGQGDINIGNNGPDVKTVTAKQNIDLAAKDGKVVVYGKTSTEVGDISIAAHKPVYTAGEDNSSFIIDQNGKLEAGGAIHLNVGNGDLHVSDRIQAKSDLVTELEEKGSLYFDTDVNVEGEVKVKTVDGDINVGHDVQGTKDIAMTAGKGNIYVGAAVNSVGGDVNLATNQGNIDIGKEVRADAGNIGVQIGTGSVTIGNNGPDVETVTARENINMGVDVGQIKIYGKTSTKLGDISMAAGANQYTPGVQNFIIEQNGLLESGRDISLTGRNGDLHVTDAIQAKRDLYAKVLEEGGVFFDNTATLKGDVTVHTEDGPISIGGQVDANLVDLATGTGNIYVGGNIASASTVSIQADTGDIILQNVISKDDIKVAVQNGNIHANNIISGETTHVALESGDLFLNLAEGKAVLLRMENNTEASKVNRVLAEARGDGNPDVTMTGNFIQIGSMAAKSGDAVFELSAMGAGNQKLIGGNFYVGSLRSGNGTHMSNLWSNRGYVHVDEGDMAVTDVLAVDKIHLDNAQTDLAVYGRTPTRDGEQLVYWNNLDMAYSKARGFQLYTNGKLRTSKAILIDADRNYGKLYGDNLSVVDMMRERVTNTHGKFTFDSMLLTEPAKALQEQVFFDMEPADAAMQQQGAGYGEIVVESNEAKEE